MFHYAGNETITKVIRSCSPKEASVGCKDFIEHGMEGTACVCDTHLCNSALLGPESTTQVTQPTTRVHISSSVQQEFNMYLGAAIAFAVSNFASKLYS